MAVAVAEEIKKLIEQGLNLDNIHLIGHSLGGQIIALIGRELQKTNILIKRYINILYIAKNYIYIMTIGRLM